MDWSRIPTPALERLREAVASRRVGVPLSEFALSSLGVPELGLPPGLSAEGVVAIVEAVLAERTAARADSVELVWTGPEARVSASRDTAVVVHELFSNAKRSVLIAGFRFDHGETLLEPLHAAMRDRGVTCAIFGDGQEARELIRRQWPFGPPFPDLYVDGREDPGFSSLHAKCVVVDAERSLVTSANFTDRGQRRNVEVGVLIADPGLAGRLQQQWYGLVSCGAFRKLP